MQKKDFRIDLLRSFACIMVLFCHSPQHYTGQSGKVFVGIDNYFGMAWGPILFFMISGACILWREQEAVPFLKKRFGRILIPTVLWSIVYIFVQCFLWHTVPADKWARMIPMILFSPQYSLMWFMYALIAIYLGAPILSRWLNKCTQREILLYLLIWGITLLLPYLEVLGIDTTHMQTKDGVFYNMSGFLWYAVAGYYCRKYVKIEKIKTWHVFLGIAILISPVYCFVIKHFSGILLDHPGCLFPALTTIFAFAFFMNVKIPHCVTEGNCRKIVESISQLSFGIYLIHMLYLYPFRIWIAQYNLNYAIQLPLTVLVVGSASTITTWLISKFKYGKYVIG